MGNNQSRSGSGTQSPAQSHHPPPPSSSISHAKESSHNVSSSARREPRRRESIQALQSGKGAPVAPTASLASATAEYKSPSTSHSSSATSARVTVSQGSTRPTTASSAQQQWLTNAPSIKPADAIASGSPKDRMGNDQSRATVTPTPLRTADGKDASLSSPDQAPDTPDMTVGPVDVPSGPIAEGVDDTPISPDQSFSLPAGSGYTRPPRLPLPIEEEDYTPGSPIISPADVTEPIEPIEGDPDGTKRTRSMLSGTTVDEDEAEDETQASGGLVGEAIGPTVPTVIEWRHGGEKVYVTGTFAGWDRKYRLHKDGPVKHKDAVSAVINLHPGTHHLNFIVDGEMRLSNDLPTAVDFTGFLVNYIEVVPHEQQLPASAAIATATGAPAAPPATDPIDIRPIPGVTTATGVPIGISQKRPQYRAPPDVRPPQVLPPTPELIATHGEDSRPVSQQAAHPQEPTTAQKDHQPPAQAKAAAQQKELKAIRIPTKYYHNVVPQFLLDLDAQDGSSTQRNAMSLSETLPAPPTLPLFLSKSVLNGAMPMKDDASVLIMPNHTVLNHLATSSIRQGVLATSATTRYRQKFLTTIIYKPTSEIDD